jgi:hypothetical protein
MIFDYLDGEPIIPLKIWSKNNTWVEFQAYADSGAGYSVFHSDVAKVLGIPYTGGEKVSMTVGDGNQITTYRHRLKVSFANEEFYAQINFAPNLGVGVNLLGQKSFFDRFTFCFQSWRKQLEIISKPGW